MRKEELFDSQIDRLEKNMTGAFNKFRVECENNIQKSEIRIEEGYHQVMANIDDFKEKLSRVDETSVVKQWVAGFVESRTNELSFRIDKNN